MKIRDMVRQVNKLTGQGIYGVDDLLSYFDECIDEINEGLTINLPSISSVYKNDFSKVEEEEDLVYVTPGYTIGDNTALDNDYIRIPDKYIRNYICYETSYRVLRDEDEDQDVYMQRAGHARSWFSKIIASLGDYRMGIGDVVLVNDDVKGSDIDEEFYSPYWNYDD